MERAEDELAAAGADDFHPRYDLGHVFRSGADYTRPHTPDSPLELLGVCGPRWVPLRPPAIVPLSRPEYVGFSDGMDEVRDATSIQPVPS